jgi:hypothetical protein
VQNTPGFLEYFNSVMKELEPELGVKAANVLSMEVMEELNERSLPF